MIAMTKRALGEAGVDVEALEGAAAASGKAAAQKHVERSGTALLVKNLPYTASEAELQVTALGGAYCWRLSSVILCCRWKASLPWTWAELAVLLVRKLSYAESDINSQVCMHVRPKRLQLWWRCHREKARRCQACISTLQYSLWQCRSCLAGMGSCCGWCCLQPRLSRLSSTRSQRTPAAPSRPWHTSASRTSRCIWSGRQLEHSTSMRLSPLCSQFQLSLTCRSGNQPFSKT